MSRWIYALLGVGVLCLLAGHGLRAAQDTENSSGLIKTDITADAGSISRQGPLLNLRVQGDVHLTSTQQAKTAVLLCQALDASGKTVEDTAVNAEGVHWKIPISQPGADGVAQQYLLSIDAHEQTQVQGSSVITLSGAGGVQAHVTLTPLEAGNKESFDLKADTVMLDRDAGDLAKQDAQATALHTKNSDAAHMTNAQLVEAIAQAVKAKEARMSLRATGGAVLHAVMLDKSANTKEAVYQKIAGTAEVITGEFAGRSGADVVDMRRGGDSTTSCRE